MSYCKYLHWIKFLLSRLFVRLTFFFFLPSQLLFLLNFHFIYFYFYFYFYSISPLFLLFFFSFFIFRFIGYSLDLYLSYLSGVSKDVLLWEKSTVLFQRIFSIILRFEKKNKIIEKLTFYFGKIILILTSFFKR